MAATGPTPPSFNPQSINDALQHSFGTDYSVAGKVNVGQDNVARFTVMYQNKEYNITVGSKFVQGFDNADTKQMFANQLSGLVLTMHQHSLEAASIQGHQLSYSGKTFNIHDVEQKAENLTTMLNKEKATAETLKKELDAIGEEMAEAQKKVDSMSPKRGWFSKGLTDEQKKELETAQKELEAVTKEYQAKSKAHQEQESIVKKIGMDHADHQIALTFKNHALPAGFRIEAQAVTSTPPTRPLPPMPDKSEKALKLIADFEAIQEDDKRELPVTNDFTVQELLAFFLEAKKTGVLYASNSLQGIEKDQVRERILEARALADAMRPWTNVPPTT